MQSAATHGSPRRWRAWAFRSVPTTRVLQLRAILEVHLLTRTAAAVVVALAVALPGDTLACGDKFLVPGRGVRFRGRPVHRESVAVLLYARPGSSLGETLRALSVEARLRKAGYRPTLATSEAGLESVLRVGAWDVVVVDLADAPGIVQRLSTAPAPTVLPVVYASTRATVDAARRQYRQVVTSPTKHSSFLEAVDRAVAAQARARAKSATKTGA